jgi:hypothetical protein
MHELPGREQLAAVRQVAAGWNAWREVHPAAAVHLARARIEGTLRVHLGAQA